MITTVTSKGQVTIPKEVRQKFGIESGARLDFVETANGIQVRKVVDRSKRPAAFGCLRKELAGFAVEELLG